MYTCGHCRTMEIVYPPNLPVVMCRPSLAFSMAFKFVVYDLMSPRSRLKITSPLADEPTRYTYVISRQTFYQHANFLGRIPGCPLRPKDFLVHGEEITFSSHYKYSFLIPVN